MKIIDRHKHYYEGTKYTYISLPKNHLLYGVTSVGRIIAGKEHYVYRQNYDIYFIIYAHKGEAKITINDETIHVKKRMIVFNSFKDKCILKVCDTSEPFVADYIYFYGPNVNYFLTEFLKSGLYLNNYDNTLFTNTVNKIYEDIINKRLDYYELSNNIYSLLLDIYKHVLESKNESNIEQIIGYINNNYFEKIDVETLANQLYLSKYHFIRKFKETTNVTPIQYLNKVRLEHSKILLKDSSLSLEEIANLVGFENTRNLNNAFKKEYGINTSLYRKKMSE